MMSVPVCTIRRWHQDPRLVDDSEVCHYVREKIKELAVTTAELAEDAAVATSEMILSRDAKGAKDMNLAYCTLIDKALLLSNNMDSARNITPTASTDGRMLLDAFQRSQAAPSAVEPQEGDAR